MKLRHRLMAHAARWSTHMADKLLENSSKGESWVNHDPKSLLVRVRQELDELTVAVMFGGPPGAIRREAADVANMAMMVADAYCGVDDDVAFREPDSDNDEVAG